MSDSHERIDTAFDLWRKRLGSSRCLTRNELSGEYYTGELRAKRNVLGVLFPEDTEEVVEIVKTAAQYHIPLYPFSRGGNRGYGGKRPVRDGCVIVDLSRMNRIVSMDRHLGLIEVEPGVTVGMVRAYLHDEKIPFLAPSIGSGAHASLIGNALERGRGAAAFIDRNASLMSIEVVLADGTRYLSPHAGDASDSFFKWGVGPYIDGLFVQNNIGIVTRATFMLAPMPACAKAVYCAPKSTSSIADMVEAMREALLRVGEDTLPNISIQNHAWMKLRGKSGSKEIKGGFPTWTLVGTVQGETEIVHASTHILKNVFTRKGLRPVFFGKDLLQALTLLAPLVPSETLRTLAAFKSLFSWYTEASNKPPLAIQTRTDQTRDDAPITDVILCALAFPMTGDVIANFVERVTDLERKYGHNTLPLKFMNMTPTCLVTSLFLLFDPRKPDERDRCTALYRDLLRAAEACGGFLYRAPIDMMQELDTKETASFWTVSKRIKQALDPDDIIAPGRYSPETSQ